MPALVRVPTPDLAGDADTELRVPVEADRPAEAGDGGGEVPARSASSVMVSSTGAAGCPVTTSAILLIAVGMV
ncbi:hypothetical protein [Microbacterium suwonense]|uniref:hypothetical protein n=1 Tax=Microbacterium suwonense TaxID=683047 RepID=UPI00257318CB|nr:hypothetical protein [Microbacterium suwonense]